MAQTCADKFDCRMVYIRTRKMAARQVLCVCDVIKSYKIRDKMRQVMGLFLAVIMICCVGARRKYGFREIKHVFKSVSNKVPCTWSTSFSYVFNIVKQFEMMKSSFSLHDTQLNRLVTIPDFGLDEILLSDGAGLKSAERRQARTGVCWGSVWRSGDYYLLISFGSNKGV